MQPEGGQSTLRGPAAAVLGALGLLAVIVALAALFDLGPFEDESSSSLTQAEFTAKGDQACERAHDQFAELQKTPPNSAEGAVALTQNLLEISESELSQIRAPRRAAGGPRGARPLPTGAGAGNRPARAGPRGGAG